ncbi:DUF7344 domain-containing protein [Halorubellus litoreus]|uniref:DUF7344 domain-containing protein n=1 Tax=Halorubellus litoreus TaxID=755308 RepID=A0ABD5VIL4_9EURY
MSDVVDTPVHELDVPEEMLPDGEDEFKKDEMFHLLQNRRRRDVLRYLRETEGAVRMRDVAEQVAAWENDTTVQQLSSDERQRVYIGLYQTHLPSLDDEGVIDYNQDRGYVEPQPLLEELVPYLDDPEDADEEEEETAGDADTERDWHQYYSAVAALGVASFVGAQTGVLAVSSELLLASMIALLVLVVGANATSTSERFADGTDAAE